MRSTNALCLVFALTGLLVAKEWWESKPFVEWSEKEAERMLDNSSWGKVHTVTINNPGFTGTRSFQSVGTGDLEREKLILFHLRFLTAKPIRMALARKILGAGKGMISMSQVQEFVSHANEQNIIVGLTLSAQPPGTSALNGYNSTLMKLSTPDVVSTTTLATGSGKRVFAIRYEAPGKDGMGAKYYFPRKLPNGQPLVTAAEKEIRFETRLTLIEGVSLAGNDTLGEESTREDRIWMPFDLRKMLFEGKIEI